MPLLLSLMCVSTSAQQPAGRGGSLPQADLRALEAAIAAYDGGHANEAEPVLARLAARYPANYPAAEALGSLYVEAGELPKALPLLKRAAALSPRDPLAHANYGAALSGLRQTHAAVAELQKAANLTPRQPAAAFAAVERNLGQAELLDGDFAAAARAFETAAKGAAADSDLLYNWSLALLRAGDAAGASAVLERIPAGERSEDAVALAADIDERLGNYQAALNQLQTAAQENPSDANLYALTVELLRHWSWPAAIKVAHFGAERYPESERFRIAEGIGHYGAGEYAAAVPLFAQVLTREPENGGVADLLGRSCSLLAEGEETDCQGVYTYAMAHPANAVMSTYAAAAILHRPQATQNVPEAEQLLKTSLVRDPTYAQAWFQLGVLYAAQQDWQRSADALEHAVTLQPALAEAHYRLSRAYAHLGRSEDAKAQLALQQSYAKQAKTDLDARLEQVVTFLLEPAGAGGSQTPAKGPR